MQSSDNVEEKPEKCNQCNGSEHDSSEWYNNFGLDRTDIFIYGLSIISIVVCIYIFTIFQYEGAIFGIIVFPIVILAAFLGNCYNRPKQLCFCQERIHFKRHFFSDFNIPYQSIEIVFLSGFLFSGKKSLHIIKSKKESDFESKEELYYQNEKMYRWTCLTSRNGRLLKKIIASEIDVDELSQSNYKQRPISPPEETDEERRIYIELTLPSLFTNFVLWSAFLPIIYYLLHLLNIDTIRNILIAYFLFLSLLSGLIYYIIKFKRELKHILDNEAKKNNSL